MLRRKRSPEAQAYHVLYHTKGWRVLRSRHLALEPYCRACAQAGRTTPGNTVDHIKPHRGDRALFFNPYNLQTLCDIHDADKHRIELGGKPRLIVGRDGWPVEGQQPEVDLQPHPAALARPQLPKPGCRVRLVCGPPASGKSTYVQNHAGPGDIVIDYDAIAKEQGLGRIRSADDDVLILTERNRRLALLAEEPPDRVAWVILAAPSPTLRQWWCRTLGISADDLLLLIPSRQELFDRIDNDPDRQPVRLLHHRLVDEWFAREAEFYQSPAWRALRLATLQRDRWRCTLCGTSVNVKGMARVDHIYPRSSHPHLELAPANVRTLCPTCEATARATQGGRGRNPGAWGE